MEEKPMAAAFDHCVAVYEKMVASAEAEVIVEGGVNKATGYVVWTGYATGLFQELGLATPYYTHIMNLLKSMGCVEQLKRGGGAAKSQWRLVRPPTEEVFKLAAARKKPRQSSLAGAEQQIRDIVKRLERLEKAMGL